MIINEDKAFWRIIMLRGLGHNLKEVADDLTLTVEQVRYRIRYIKELVAERGDEKVFFQAVKLFLARRDLKDTLVEYDQPPPSEE